MKACVRKAYDSVKDIRVHYHGIYAKGCTGMLGQLVGSPK